MSFTPKFITRHLFREINQTRTLITKLWREEPLSEHDEDMIEEQILKRDIMVNDNMEKTINKYDDLVKEEQITIDYKDEIRNHKVVLKDIRKRKDVVYNDLVNMFGDDF